MAVQITTPNYWEVDGVPLNTYAYNISTLTGRTGTGPLKGEDSEQPYRTGRNFRPKVPDSRTLPLSMWVLGLDPDTAAPASDVGAQFMSNLRMLERLFFQPRRQFVLTKRWTDLDGLHTAEAKGQVFNAIQPAHTLNRAAMVVDVFLADPFFYDVTPTVVNIPMGDTVSSVNPGDGSSENFLTVTFTGPLTNPVLKNTSSDPDIALSFTGSVPSGQSLVVDVASTRALLNGALVNTGLTYTGSIWPMEVFRGSNTFTLTGSGTGSASVSYRAAYL